MGKKDWHRKYTKKHLGRRCIDDDEWNSCPKSKNTGTKVVIAIFIIMGTLIVLANWGDLDSLNSTINSTINQVNPKIESPLKPEININDLELRIHQLINEERNSRGLDSLSWDSKLSDIARAHSINMANYGFFDHNNLGGQDPSARATAAGYNCQKDLGGGWYTEGIAENIFQNNLYNSVTYIPVPIYNWNTEEEIATSTVVGWMASPGHKENILTNTYDREGIGIAINSDEEVLITQNFC